MRKKYMQQDSKATGIPRRLNDMVMPSCYLSGNSILRLAGFDEIASPLGDSVERTREMPAYLKRHH